MKCELFRECKCEAIFSDKDFGALCNFHIEVVRGFRDIDKLDSLRRLQEW